METEVEVSRESRAETERVDCRPEDIEAVAEDVSVVAEAAVSAAVAEVVAGYHPKVQLARAVELSSVAEVETAQLWSWA